MLREIATDTEKSIKKYADEYEIYVSQVQTLNLDAENSDLSFAKEEVDRGLGIRIIKDKKLGFAYTSNINKIEETVKKAVENAKLNEEDEYLSLANKSKIPKVKGTVDKNYDNIELDDILSFMEDTINEVKEKDCTPTSGGFSKLRGENVILNSNGVDLSSESTGFGAYISVIANEDETSSAYNYVNSNKYDFTSEKMVNKSCEIAKSSIGGINIDTEDKNVVLDYFAATGLLSTFMNGFSGDNVLRGRSLLKDKIGETIVSDNLSIFDDGLIDNGLNSSEYDGEGSPSQRTELVKNGVLKGFVYDIYTGNKSNCETTGNASRGLYASTPSIDFSNLVFDFEDKIEYNDIKAGVFATSLLGAHTANPITGDFSVEVNNGFIIEDGEKTKPIKKAMISGNVYEILKDCKGINSDVEQHGNFILPQILIPKLRVIG